jgi:hypothetical protein
MACKQTNQQINKTSTAEDDTRNIPSEFGNKQEIGILLLEDINYNQLWDTVWEQLQHQLSDV